MNNTGWVVILIIVLVVIALGVGIAIGAKVGANSIAEKWCAAEGYGEGKYDYPDPSKRIQEGGKRVICWHAKPVYTKGE